MKLTDIQIPLGNAPADQLLTGGQPTQADFEAMAAAGLRHVIDLRPLTEDHGFDEAALAAKLGLKYTNIPIAGPQDIGDDNARKLDAAMTDGEPTLVHCASSNRVAALLALRAAHIQGKSAEEALAFGRAAGLTKMEPLVQQLLAK